MAQVDVRRTYGDGEILLASDLDAFLNDFETFLNITKLNDDNIQNNGINGTTKIADNTVTTNKLANNAITTTKITDASVTADKLADDAVTTAKIADDAVTTVKIADSTISATKVTAEAKGLFKKLSEDVLTGAVSGNWTVPADVYTIWVYGIKNGVSFNGVAYTQANEIMRVVVTTPGASIAYVVPSGATLSICF